MAIISFSALENANNIQDNDVLVFQRANTNSKNNGQVKISWADFKSELEAELDSVVGNLNVAGDLTVGNITYATTIVASEDISAVNIDLTGGITASAGSCIVGFFNTDSGVEVIPAGTGGAIAIDNYTTIINTDAGGDAYTLADATQIGQLKRIRLLADGGGDGVVTCTGAGFTTITFNDAGDSVELIWKGADWFLLDNNGCTVA